MIGYIKGVVTHIGEDNIILENNGIGYFIFTSRLVINNLTGTHNEVKIFTYMHVREDEISLFGFLSKEELDAFKLLLMVNGIGPKVALSILSVLTVSELTLAIMAGDTKALTKANGVGTKGANRIIIELKDKMDIHLLDSEINVSVNMNLEAANAKDNVSDTVLALVSLGYSESEAVKAIGRVDGAKEMDAEELLKNALKKLY